MDRNNLLKLAVCLFFLQCARVESQACIQGQLDVLFVLDSSSSVSSGDFTSALGFAANLAENFAIGAGGFQFGAVTFADNPNNLYNLNTYTDYNELKKDTLSALYLSGNTKTYLVLENGRNLLDVSHGARIGTPKVAIVFSNGKSDDYARTQQQATLLKDFGVYVIAVGLSNPNDQELQGIASGPDAVFNFQNFNSVLQHLQNYSAIACSQQVPCIKGQVDILLIVDSSSNVGVDDFNLELGVATNLAENFRIGPDAIQFGAFTFADNSQHLLDFDTYTDYNDIKTAILHAQYLAGSTNTFVALENSTDYLFGSHGSRRGASKVAVVFTNGKSGDSARTQQQADVLKSLGVYIIVVGLANSNNQELQAIASEPQAVIQIDNFNSILQALQNYINNTCDRARCMKGKFDVLYVIDSSSNVASADFIIGLGFASNLAENFQIGADAVQFGVITYADNPNRQINFNSSKEFKDLQKALLRAVYTSGGTNTFLALEASGKFFDASPGARIGAPKVAIVITSGKSSDPVKTAQQAAYLKQSGVYVIAVGFSGVNNLELKSIASGTSAVFDISNFNGVLSALQNYSNNACSQSK